ncbi:hypothetical protein EDC04DRAFT_2903047 [Pisolithus marmoratus]|nr:hypothetical protein EDC04DRAFT_2903047 [Pisolithus marmoratus]
MLSPSPEGHDPPQSFSIFLTVYSKIRKTSARGKTTLKEEKSTKMKELLFTTDNSNYLDFLQAILLKHGLESYEVMEKKHFPLKYVPPKAKGQWASDTIDVNNAADYREMVKKISEEKLAISSEDDSEFASDSMKGKSGHVKKVDLDNHLAQWRLKLEKAYKNEQDEGLTYVGVLGSIPLMPAMVCDWCLVLEDGQAAMQAVQPASPAAVDLNSLTSAILLWMLAQFDSSLHPPTSPASPMPQTPARNRVKDGDDRSLPPVPSPGKLVCYLEFAESHLGVHHAMSYKSALELHGIGPDILPDVSDKLLADLGLSAGDAICLKKGSTTWWNGPDPKQKRSNALTSGTPSPAAKCSNTQDLRPAQVFYEKQFHNGGGGHFSAPPMRKNDDDSGSPPEQDFDLFYHCETLKQWLPVLHGYSVDEDAEDSEEGE